MNDKEQKLKEEIFRENLKVKKEITEALCRLSRKNKDNKKSKEKEEEER